MEKHNHNIRIRYNILPIENSDIRIKYNKVAEGNTKDYLIFLINHMI